MKYVDVIIIGPDERRYSAQVDRDSSEKTLLDDLIDGLRLPRTEKDGKTRIEYGINLIGAAKIRAGTTIQIYEKNLSEHKHKTPSVIQYDTTRTVLWLTERKTPSQVAVSFRFASRLKAWLTRSQRTLCRPPNVRPRDDRVSTTITRFT